MKNIEKIEEQHGEEITGAIVLEGFDDAIRGVVKFFHGGVYHTTLVYDREQILEDLMEQGMTEEEALEYFSFNIECAHMGQKEDGSVANPAFFISIKED